MGYLHSRSHVNRGCGGLGIASLSELVAGVERMVTAEPIHSDYVLINLDHLVNMTSLEPERWKRAHAESSEDGGGRVPGIRPAPIA